MCGTCSTRLAAERKGRYLIRAMANKFEVELQAIAGARRAGGRDALHSMVLGILLASSQAAADSWKCLQMFASPRKPSQGSWASSLQNN